MEFALSDSKRLTHIDPETGEARMVDVGAKAETERLARARARVRMSLATWSAIRDKRVAKGDVVAVARLAGIGAAKRTADLIPLCHPLRLTGIEVEVRSDEPCLVEIETCVRARDRTGVEMEALTAASVAALAIYDMCKALERTITIEEICLVEKSGGVSGHFQRDQG